MRFPPLENVPVLPLRDVVVYLHMVIPRSSARKSIQAAGTSPCAPISALWRREEADVDDPRPRLYRIANVATILQC